MVYLFQRKWFKWNFTCLKEAIQFMSFLGKWQAGKGVVCGWELFLMVFYSFHVWFQPPPPQSAEKILGLRPWPPCTPPLPWLAPFWAVQEIKKLDGWFAVDFHTLHISKMNPQKQLWRLKAFINSETQTEEAEFFQPFLFIPQLLVREQCHKTEGKKSFWTNLAPSCMASCE